MVLKWDPVCSVTSTTWAQAGFDHGQDDRSRA
jgi:hypothetical protein